MKKFRGVFAKFWDSSDFRDLWNYFPQEKSVEYVHSTVDWVHHASFDWGLLLRDHCDEGNVFMLILIGGEWQRSPATVRWLGWCLSTVRATSGEVSTPRMCAKASSSSPLASRPTNCSDRQWKTQIWWLPRVRRVLDLRPKIHTICGTIYRGF
jgi:hypothetical protein